MYRIMIVDDFKVFRTKMKRLSCWKNYPEFEIAFEACDGACALELLKENPVDMVITDIQMPKMNGLELLKEIKEQNLCNCVILLSEYTEFEYARQGIILGALDYIVKPITNENLSRVLIRVKESLSQNTKSTPLSFELTALLRSLLNRDDALEEKVNYLFQQAEPYIQKDINKTAILLSNFLSLTYKQVIKKYPWMMHIAPDLKSVQSKVTGSNNTEELKEHFTSYLYTLDQFIHTFQAISTHDLVWQACSFVLEHPFEKITLTDAANFCFVNKSYLSHTFKQETGISFVDYVTKFKMEIAKKHFDETNLRIFEIASLLGYDDSKYFGKLFKNYFLMSPAEYKRVQN